MLWNFKLKNEASRANLNKNKRIFKWRPFWNKVYGMNLFDSHPFPITFAHAILLTANWPAIDNF